MEILLGNEEIFLGYCYLPDETYPSPVHLKGIEQVRSYITIQLPFQHRLVICDSEDYRIFESLEGKVIFPPVS